MSELNFKSFFNSEWIESKTIWSMPTWSMLIHCYCLSIDLLLTFIQMERYVVVNWVIIWAEFETAWQSRICSIQANKSRDNQFYAFSQGWDCIGTYLMLILLWFYYSWQESLLDVHRVADHSTLLWVRPIPAVQRASPGVRRTGTICGNWLLSQLLCINYLAFNAGCNATNYLNNVNKAKFTPPDPTQLVEFSCIGSGGVNWA